MATTDTGFSFKYDFGGTTTGALKQVIIASSQTIQVGGLVLVNAAGHLSVATAGNPIFGVVVALVDVNGIDMENTRVTKDGTYTASTRSYAASASNGTGSKFSALVNTSKTAVYSAQPDSAIGTTTGSNLLGYYCDIATGGLQPDEDTTATSSTVQLFIWGVDPDNTAHGLYSIHESMI